MPKPKKPNTCEHCHSIPKIKHFGYSWEFRCDCGKEEAIVVTGRDNLEDAVEAFEDFQFGLSAETILSLSL